MNGRVDVLGVSETHVRGRGMSDGREGMWKSVPGGVVWTGMDERYKGRGKEGCAIVMLERLWNGVTDYGWKGSRIVWVKGKVGLIKYTWVCIYIPVNATSKRGLREREVFWEDVNTCLKSFETERKLVMMGDMNGKVGDECVMDVVGK